MFCPMSILWVSNFRYIIRLSYWNDFNDVKYIDIVTTPCHLEQSHYSISDKPSFTQSYKLYNRFPPTLERLLIVFLVLSGTWLLLGPLASPIFLLSLLCPESTVFSAGVGVSSKFEGFSGTGFDFVGWASFKISSSSGSTSDLQQSKESPTSIAAISDRGSKPKPTKIRLTFIQAEEWKTNLLGLRLGLPEPSTLPDGKLWDYHNPNKMEELLVISSASTVTQFCTC